MKARPAWTPSSTSVRRRSTERASPLDKQFDLLRSAWDHLGERDPLWAILADPRKRGNRWDLEAFLATGKSEAVGLLRMLAGSFADVPRGRALDFGCGVGRVTRALAGHFESVTGVDVAPSMIRKARELGAGIRGLEYVVNEQPDLAFIASGSIDL